MVNRRKIHWRDTFFVASPGEGLNEFGYVSGAIEDRVIHNPWCKTTRCIAWPVLWRRHNALNPALQSVNNTHLKPGQFFCFVRAKNTRSELRVFFI
jgi:hypothetical protein